MKENEFSKDCFNIITNLARQQSVMYWQTYCGSIHLFLATMKFLNNNKTSPRYRVACEKFKKIVQDYGITGAKLKETIIAGSEPAEGEKFNITPDEDYNKIIEELKRKALQEKRSMEVEDLIAEMFGDNRYAIYSIFSQITGSDQQTSKLFDEMVKQFKNEKKKVISELDKLKEVQNINKYVKEKPQEMIGMDKEISQLELALCTRKDANALLVGPAGVGKTSVIYELAKRINAGTVADSLKDKIIYEINQTALVAGTRFRGDMEEKIENILSAAAKNKQVILFIDEAHGLVKLGDSEGATSAANILKPYLSRGDIQLILATTNEEFTKFLLPDKAFVRRFQRINIEEPTKVQTTEILKGLIKTEEEFYKRTIDKGLIDKIVNLSERYTLDQANPAKALGVMENAFTFSKVKHPDEKEVTIDDIIESTKEKYNVYVSDTKFNDTEKELHSYLLGQDEALNQFCKQLKLADLGLVENDKPMVSVFLVGPSGTGKTELAKIVAEKYFGNREKNLIKINCGEYSAEMDVSKLTGASSGYVGYEDEPALIKQVRQYPNSVILFDEIEKAHKSVLKVLLNILDAGEMTDNKGNRVSFKNTVIIFTSNLGYTIDFAKEKGIGFVKSAGDKKDIQNSLEKYFAPEFIGRLDAIITFNNLSQDIADQLIERYRKDFAAIIEKDVKFKKSDIEEIKKRARIEELGARSLRKSVKEQVGLVLSREGENK